MSKSLKIRASWAALVCCLAFSTLAMADTARKVNIPAGELSSALRMLGEQLGAEFVYSADQLKGVRTEGVRGTFTTEEAVIKLLEGTSLKLTVHPSGALLISDAKAPIENLPDGSLVTNEASNRQAESDPGTQEDNPSGSASATSESSSDAAVYSQDKGTPEILIRGRRSINVDLRRSEDDVQPYVVFDRATIERSQAPDIEGFLKTRLPMNSAQGSLAQQTQSGTTFINSGSVNLRGLGTNQTLILVDGRRVPGIQLEGNSSQANINAIPLAAIERIEILPSTASAIYGGGATGGVINIIRRQDYSGVNLAASFGDTFDSGARSLQISGTGGFSFEDGRTHLSVSASHSEETPLYVVDRDFASRSRQRVFANNPNLFLNSDSGAPPLGATSNICAATQWFPGFSTCNGELLTVKGGASLGSSFTSVPRGYAGPASDDAAALVANAGTYNLDIPDDGQFLLRKPNIQSASVNLRRDFGSRFMAYIDAQGDRNEMAAASAAKGTSVLLPSSSPDNPFDQDILANFPAPSITYPAYSQVDTLRLASGVVVRLPNYWSAQLEYGWSRSRSGSADTLLRTDPTDEVFLEPGALRDLEAFPLDIEQFLLPPLDTLRNSESVLTDMALRVSGPVAQLPGGPFRLSGLLEHRKERATFEYLEQPEVYFGAENTFFYPPRHQSVDSAYLEASVPIISSVNSRSWARELELQASLRHDRYETVSTTDLPAAETREGPFDPAVYSTNEVSSTDYLLGVRFSPLKSLALRASVASGFLPPSLSQISSFTFLMPVSDLPFYNVTGDQRRDGTPIAGDADGNIASIVGGNPDLRPEESKSWSAGIILTPAVLPGLRWSVDYTRIEKTSEISTFADLAFILAHEADYPGRVIRGPNLPGDDPDWAGPILGIDTSAINLSSSLVEAYDTQIEYAVESERFGTFEPYLVATLATRFERQVLPTSPLYDVIGYSDGGAPLRWRGNFGIDWDRGRWGASWSGQYFDSYSITYADPNGESSNAPLILNQGTERIPSQMYHDVQVRFRYGDGEQPNSVLAGMELSLGIQNVFNHSPPIVTNYFGEPEGGYSRYGDPRLRRFMLTVRKQFGMKN